MPAERQNPSLDPAQLTLIREINALDLPYGVTSKIVDAIRRHEALFRAPVEVVETSQPTGAEGGRENADGLSGQRNPAD